MQFHDRLADRQTEAEPLATSAGLCEGVEDFFEIFRFNPNAGVADLDLQSLRLRVKGPHRDGAAFGSEFRSVPQDIPKYLLQPRGVCEDVMIGCEKLDGNIELPRGEIVADDVHGVPEQIVRVGFSQVQLQFPARDAGQVEQIIDEAGLELDVAANHL